MYAQIIPSPVAQYRAAKLESAIEEWIESEQWDIGSDLEDALWSDTRIARSPSMSEDLASDW